MSAQRDLPASLTVIATYLGSRGHNLMQQFLPNTYPAGAVTPCATCPAGFAYLTSDGPLAAQRRPGAGAPPAAQRVHREVQYTLAKATDDAAAFAGATLAGVGMAQDWLDLDAEYAPLDLRPAAPGGRRRRSTRPARASPAARWSTAGAGAC